MRLPGITHEGVTWLLAPHIHIAMRGTLSRTELRQVLAATYHQVWWLRVTVNTLWEAAWADIELPR